MFIPTFLCLFNHVVGADNRNRGHSEQFLTLAPCTSRRDHIGGVTPSRPTRHARPCSAPSGCLIAAMNTFAPSLRSLLSPCTSRSSSPCQTRRSHRALDAPALRSISAAHGGVGSSSPGPLSPEYARSIPGGSKPWVRARRASLCPNCVSAASIRASKPGRVQCA